MRWNDIAAVVGVVTGIVSLLGIIYLSGYWKGSIDEKIDNKVDKEVFARVDNKVETLIDNKVDKEVFARVDNKVETLYDWFIEQIVKKEGHKGSSNPKVNNPHPQINIPQNLQQVIERITIANMSMDDSRIVSIIIQELATYQRNEMEMFRQERGLSVEQFIHLIADEVRRIRENR
jgi:hypothetical protein